MSEVHIFTDVDMAEGEYFELPGMRVGILSSPKPGREGPNEDAAAIVSLGKTAMVLVLSDGAGGHPGGADAAGLAVRAVCDAVTKLDGDLTNLRGAVINGFESANGAIASLGTGAAATLAVVEIRDGRMRAYHAGDSMVLVTGQRGKVKWLNIPHSPVGYAVEAGLLDRGDALHHEDLHLVSNMLGDQHMRIELGASVKLAARDTVVIASDGLGDNLHLDEIVERVRKGPLKNAVDALATLGRKRMVAPEEGAPSKPDDLTLIALRQRTPRRRAREIDPTDPKARRK